MSLCRAPFTKRSSPRRGAAAKTFSLIDGSCLTGGTSAIRTFPVKADNGDVWIELPPPQQLEAELCPGSNSCAPHAAVGA